MPGLRAEHTLALFLLLVSGLLLGHAGILAAAAPQPGAAAWALLPTQGLTRARTLAYNTQGPADVKFALSPSGVPHVLYSDSTAGGAVVVRSFTAGAWKRAGTGVLPKATNALPLMVFAGSSIYVLFSEAGPLKLYQLVGSGIWAAAPGQALLAAYSSPFGFAASTSATPPPAGSGGATSAPLLYILCRRIKEKDASVGSLLRYTPGSGSGGGGTWVDVTAIDLENGMPAPDSMNGGDLRLRVSPAGSPVVFALTGDTSNSGSSTGVNSGANVFVLSAAGGWEVLGAWPFERSFASRQLVYTPAGILYAAYSTQACNQGGKCAIKLARFDGTQWAPAGVAVEAADIMPEFSLGTIRNGVYLQYWRGQGPYTPIIRTFINNQWATLDSAVLGTLDWYFDTFHLAATTDGQLYTCTADAKAMPTVRRRSVPAPPVSPAKSPPPAGPGPKPASGWSPVGAGSVAPSNGVSIGVQDTFIAVSPSGTPYMVYTLHWGGTFGSGDTYAQAVVRAFTSGAWRRIGRQVLAYPGGEVRANTPGQPGLPRLAFAPDGTLYVALDGLLDAPGSPPKVRASPEKAVRLLVLRYSSTAADWQLLGSNAGTFLSQYCLLSDMRVVKNGSVYVSAAALSDASTGGVDTQRVLVCSGVGTAGAAGCNWRDLGANAGYLRLYGVEGQGHYLSPSGTLHSISTFLGDTAETFKIELVFRQGPDRIFSRLGAWPGWAGYEPSVEVKLAFLADGTPLLAYSRQGPRVASYNNKGLYVMRYSAAAEEWVPLGGQPVGIEYEIEHISVVGMQGDPEGTAASPVVYVAHTHTDAQRQNTFVKVRKFAGGAWYVLDTSQLKSNYFNELQLVAVPGSSSASSGSSGSQLLLKYYSYGQGAFVKAWRQGTLTKQPTYPNTPPPSPAPQGSWVPVGKGFVSYDSARSPALAVAPDGSLYVAYRDTYTSGRTFVKAFQGGQWVLLANTTLPPALHLHLAAAAGGKLYLACHLDSQPDRDGGDGSGPLQVQRFAAGKWEQLGNASFSQSFSLGDMRWPTGSVVASASSSLSGFFVGSDGALYLKAVKGGKQLVALRHDGRSWRELPGTAAIDSSGAILTRMAPNGTLYQISAYSSGATLLAQQGSGEFSDWVPIGDGFAFGKEVEAATVDVAFGPDGLPWGAFVGQGKLSVFRFNGTGWVPVGTSASIAAGLPVMEVQVCAAGATPYVSYKSYPPGQRGTTGTLHVAALSKGTWVHVKTDSLSGNTAEFALVCSGGSSNRPLYATFIDWDQGKTAVVWRLAS